MSHKNELINQYFKQAPVAILIFQNDELIESNDLAQSLETELNFSPQYLAEIAQATLKRQSKSTGCCPHCQVMNTMTDVSMPVLSQCTDSPLKNYYMTYTMLDKQSNTFSLTLKNYGAIGRINVVADRLKQNCAINDAQEETRRTISADLHDSIAQGVYAAIMGVRKLNEPCDCAETMHKQTSVIEAQLRDTLREVKDMALNVRPSVLDTFGLVEALKTLAERIETATGVKISVAGNAKGQNLTPTVQNTLYRIAQEAINNVLKHADATEVLLLLVEHQNHVSLQIVDNGVGFNVTEHQSFNGHSLGLHDMADRIESLNGVFEIESKIGVGTTITVKFPVKVMEGSLPDA
ncbi:MAG TPA: sensor histidine kinase [Lactobacillus sp.]|nr:sensor histidine kinase [Lactobacillus sp.]